MAFDCDSSRLFKTKISASAFAQRSVKHEKIKSYEVMSSTLEVVGERLASRRRGVKRHWLLGVRNNTPQERYEEHPDGHAASIGERSDVFLKLFRAGHLKVLTNAVVVKSRLWHGYQGKKELRDCT